MFKFSKSKKDLTADKKLHEFEDYMTGEKKSCKNKCIFCFIDQLPKDCLRETLYFKDDDERLSFLHGNYITLTNLEDSDIDRIIKMRISPINISVHTTNPELRIKMMNNKRAGEVLSYIKKLAEADINLNAQIVLCKNINDGKELEKTLTDLCELYPSMQSVAVVPSGLTKYRGENKLFKLEAFNKSDCEKIIETVDKFGEENLKKYNSRLVYCADEFYLNAGLEIPGSEYYEDYPQYENGVGMLRNFCDDFYKNFEQFVGDGVLDVPPTKSEPRSNSRNVWCDDINELRSFHASSIKSEPRLNSRDVEDLNDACVVPVLYNTPKPRKISVVTGEAAYHIIKTLADDLIKKCVNLKCHVYKIKNDFFGEEIMVAGLVTGRDIINQLTPYKNNLGEELLIPAVMLRYERDLFLDGTSIEDIENALKIKVKIVENEAEDFIKAVLNRKIL